MRQEKDSGETESKGRCGQILQLNKKLMTFATCWAETLFWMTSALIPLVHLAGESRGTSKAGFGRGKQRHRSVYFYCPGGQQGSGSFKSLYNGDFWRVKFFPSFNNKRLLPKIPSCIQLLEAPESGCPSLHLVTIGICRHHLSCQKWLWISVRNWVILR